MSDQILDIKDIKEAVQDVVQLSEKKWTSERDADKKAYDLKMSNAIDKVVNDQKAIIDNAKKEMQDQFDSALVDMKKQVPSQKTSFKDALGEGIKNFHSQIVEGGNRQGKMDVVIDTKDFNYTDFTGFAGFVTDFSNQPILNPYSPFHWRDIVPIGSTGSQNITWPKETATAGAADVWTHAGDAAVSKPQINPSLSTYTANVEWIAGLIKGIPISMLEDLPWLTSYIQNKAINELMKAEDLQIQSGSGVSPNLSGFFTGTNSTVYNGSKTLFVEKLIDAAYRQIADSFYNANRVVISNTDKVDILLTEKSTGAGYGLPGGSVAIVNGEINMAGLQVSSTALLAASTALVGDFSQSQFVIRSAPRLVFFDQNGTDAEKNQIMARIEERAALAIFSGAAFVKLLPST